MGVPSPCRAEGTLVNLKVCSERSSATHCGAIVALDVPHLCDGDFATTQATAGVLRRGAGGEWSEVDIGFGHEGS
jgi:hypothetical protein